MEQAAIEPAEAAALEQAEAAGARRRRTCGGRAGPGGPAARAGELVMATAGAVIPEPRNAAERPDGIAAIESMLARTQLPMPGYEDEETW